LTHNVADFLTASAPEPEYVLVRKVLLDELEALSEQGSACAGDSSR